MSKKKTTVIITSIAIFGLFITTAVYAYENDLWQNPKMGQSMGHKFNEKPLNPDMKMGHRKKMLGNVKKIGIEILGLSQEEVKSKMDSGMTFKGIIEQSGYTQESFKKAVQEKIFEQIKSKLERLVEKGELSKEEMAEQLEIIKLKNENRKKTRESILAAQAELLDMSVDELKAKLESGKKMRDLVEEAGFEFSKFHEKMAGRRKAIAKAHLEDLLAQGKITQREYDKKMEFIEKGAGKKIKNKFKKNFPNIKPHLEELVDEGVITREQLEKIMEKLKSKAKGFFHPKHPGFLGASALEIPENK